MEVPAVEPTYTDGRLGGPPGELNIKHIVFPGLQGSLGQFDQYLRVDLAHVSMLATTGILPIEHAAAILEVLCELRHGGPDELEMDPQYGSFLLQVERYLTERIGEDLAGRMHTGRSRNDHSATADRLYARERLLDILGLVADLQAQVIALAHQHLRTYMPGYTHLQCGQPTTLAHYVMRYCFMFERDQQRLEGAYSRTSLNSLGGGALTGTSWPIDREQTASLLGLEGLVENAFDAGIFQRDYPLENAAALSLLMATIGQLAGDLYVWCSHEFNMVSVDDSFAGTSSIMPQKKNPHVLEKVRALSGRSLGWTAAMMGMSRSTTSSDLDMMWGGDILPEAADDATAAIELLTAGLSSMTFNTGVMESRLSHGWTAATSLADEIVRQSGVPFRAAHRVVARLVRKLEDQGLGPEDVTAEAIDEAAVEMIGHAVVGEASSEMIAALDPVQSVNRLASKGSANPAFVSDQIMKGEELLRGHRAWLAAKRSLIARADQALQAITDDVIAQKGGQSHA